jgi:citrate synthase
MHDLTLQLTQPFWREEPFTDNERQLLDALFLAHHRSAFRDNPSSVTAINAAAGSGDLGKAIAAAILTTGGKHAPLEATTQYLLSYPDAIEWMDYDLKRGHKIPGWGGTFQKEGADPIWSRVASLLNSNWPLIAKNIADVTLQLRSRGKELYPNPSAYTAAVAIAIGLSAKLAPYLFAAARLSAWTQIAARVI